MSDPIDTYLEELAARLRARGLASQQAEEIAREAASHLREAGGKPADVVGTVEEFTEAIVSRGLDGTDAGGDWEYRTIEGATACN